MQQVFSKRRVVFAPFDTNATEQEYSEQVSHTVANCNLFGDLKSSRTAQVQSKTLSRSSAVHGRHLLNPELEMEVETEGLPRLDVRELSSYGQQEICESTFMQMTVPQGPGIALRFLTDEPSTCFTPNFEFAQTTSLNTYQASSSMAETADFDFTQT